MASGDHLVLKWNQSATHTLILKLRMWVMIQGFGLEGLGFRRIICVSLTTPHTCVHGGTVEHVPVVEPAVLVTLR
jgi:hypothetical protein